MVKVQGCDIVVSEFDIQLHYYVDFWTNNLEKDPFTSPLDMG